MALPRSHKKDEDFSYKSLIASHLKELTESTSIGTDLIIRLYEHNLIHSEDRELLLDEREPTIRKSVILYTSIASRWTDSNFEEFKTILEDTGNFRASQILFKTPPKPSVVCDKVQKENELLKQPEGKSETLELFHLEPTQEFCIDFEAIFARQKTFFENCSIEKGTDNQSFTISGVQGAGKTFICSQVQSELSEIQPDIQIVWTETFTRHGIVNFLEGFNCHSCDFSKCDIKPLAHHLKLIVRKLEESKQRYLFFIPISNELAANFFTELLRNLSTSLCHKNVWIVRLVNSSHAEVLKKRETKLGIPENHSRKESEFLARSINKSFPDGTILNLQKLAYSNPMLLKLAASIINIQSPIFGISGDRQLQQIKRINPTTSDENPSSHAIAKYVWDYMSRKHPHGIFAQQILALAVYMKTWIPISILHALKFPSSTYEASNIPDGRPVSAVTCNLLRSLGLLIFHSANEEARVSNVMKDYVYNQILNKTIPRHIWELILLNMRFTEGFINSFVGPFDIIKDVISSRSLETLKEHVMAILRKPNCRLQLSQSKGVSTEIMLKQLQRLLLENKTFSAEENIEIQSIIYENQFYDGHPEAALDSLQKTWISLQEQFQPDNKTNLRITQTLCFLFENIKSKNASFYFMKLVESGHVGVVDEEALSANKSFYEIWAQNRGTSWISNVRTKQLASPPAESESSESSRFSSAAGKKTGDEATNWQQIIQNNFMELELYTAINLQLVITLMQNGMINKAEMDILMNENEPNGQRATILYTLIAPRWENSKFPKFKSSLEGSGNARALTYFRNATWVEPTPDVGDKAFDWKAFVRTNTAYLVSSTIIVPELVLYLLKSQMIYNTEKNVLMDTNTSHSEKALFLYTHIAGRWTDSEFGVFKLALEVSENRDALSIFKNQEEGHFSSK